MSTPEPDRGAPFSRTPDRAAKFSRTYESCYGRVHAYAVRRVGIAAADEVTAETFLVAWRRFEVVPPEALPWLYGVARNVVLRHLSRQARQAATHRALRSEPVYGEEVESDGDGLWNAWAGLSSLDQEVLALVAWEELPVRDAARAMGCSAPLFSVRLYRARKRFERLLEHPAGGSRPVSNLSEAR